MSLGMSLFALVILGAVVLGLKVLMQSGGAIASEYVRAQSLFSGAEKAFLRVLDDAVGDEYRVFGKVRIADVVDVKACGKRGERQSALNRISAKHFDFVVCRKDSLAVVCAVELNDRSHAEPRRMERDGFIADVCKRIGLPLVQIAASSGYSKEDIRGKVMNAIGKSGNALS